MMKNKQKPKAEESRVNKKTSAIFENIKSSPFKKISAIVGFIAVLIGLIAGSIGLVKQCVAVQKLKREIAMHIEVGDRFVEQDKLNEGIAEYEKAFALEKDNIDAHRRIISVMRLKIELYCCWRPRSWYPTAEEIQSRIFQLQALHPRLKDDTDLMMDEARALWRLAYDSNRYGRYQPPKHVAQLLERAYEISPENPEVLAQLGYWRSLHNESTEESGVKLLKRAVEMDMENPRYRYYLGRALQRTNELNQAANEFWKGWELLKGDNLETRQLRRNIGDNLKELLRYYSCTKGPLTSDIDLPLSGRIEILESGNSYGWSIDLAKLYYATEQYEKADAILRSVLDDFYDGLDSDENMIGLYNPHTHHLRVNYESGSNHVIWQSIQALVSLHIEILEAFGEDQAALARARHLLKRMTGIWDYWDNLETTRWTFDRMCKYERLIYYNSVSHAENQYGECSIWITDQPQCDWDPDEEKIKWTDRNYYCMRIIVHLTRRPENILVHDVGKDGLFAKAGVKKGDRIVEFAGKRVRHIGEVEILLMERTHGDEIPMKVRRGNRTIQLNFKVETTTDKFACDRW